MRPDSADAASMVIGNVAIRPAVSEDARVIARIWNSGWREAHLEHVPPELAQARTPESFVSRAAANLSHTTVATVDGSVIGFVVTISDEVEQMYVDASARGGSVASTLLAAAEASIAVNGYTRAWLAVIGDNPRARRFYERCGWADDGEFSYSADTSGEPIEVTCRRYVKALVARTP